MADLIEALVGWLRTQDTLTALLSKDAKNVPRIHGDELPQSVKTTDTAIVLYEISGMDEEHLRGTATLSWMRIQFDCIAPVPAIARRLRATLKAAIQSILRTAVGTVRVANAMHQGDHHADVPPADGSQQTRFVRSVDYQFSYQNS